MRRGVRQLRQHGSGWRPAPERFGRPGDRISRCRRPGDPGRARTAPGGRDATTAKARTRPGGQARARAVCNDYGGNEMTTEQGSRASGALRTTFGVVLFIGWAVLTILWVYDAIYKLAH